MRDSIRRNGRLKIQVPALLLLACALPAALGAHHGWGWASDEEFEITGTIVAVRLGNPHGEVTIEVNDETWVVEVGQPWRNTSAGLEDTLLERGTEITVHGHRSAKPGERLVKAERVTIDGVSHNLYPDRESESLGSGE